MVIKNFLFHRISPIRDKLWDPMSPELFDKVINYINKNYHIVSLESYYLSSAKEKYSKPLATILFDDGYKDNIDYAADILKKYNCSASFYVVTDCIDKNIPTWTYIFEYLFQNTQKLSVDFNKEDIPEIFKISTWSDKNERIEYARKFKPYLKQVSHNKRESIINCIMLNFDDVLLPKTMMSWDDINELSDSGFIIGSHSVTHTMLATIEDKNLLYRELNDSAKIISEKTGKYPITISYPIGSYDNQVIEYSKKCGYKLGLAVKQRFYDSEKDNLFEIPRVELYNESWFKTKLRISGTLEIIKKIIR